MNITSELWAERNVFLSRRQRNSTVIRNNIFLECIKYVVTGGRECGSLVLLRAGLFAIYGEKQSIECMEIGGAMYQKVSTDLNFVQREKEIEKFNWV